MKRIIRYIIIGLGGFTALILLYLATAYGLSRIPVNGNTRMPGEMHIYILTNGVHTDIVVPVRHELFDWSKTIPYHNTSGNDTSAEFLAFGWGDKGFYLQTPAWSDLKFSVAFNAMFGLSTSAIHATFYREMREDGSCRKIPVSREGYLNLCRFILNSFALSPDGKPVYIKTTANYGTRDAFYEGTGRYSLFRTCNTWANDALKSAGLKAGLWTAFDTGIFYHYPNTQF